MLRPLVQTGLLALAAYAAVGAMFALAFHLRGLARVDPATTGGGPGFRLLITPGVIALWPVLAWRWRRTVLGSPAAPPADPAPAPRRLRALHRLAWQALAAVVPLLLAAALLTRPPERPASVLPVTAAPR